MTAAFFRGLDALVRAVDRRPTTFEATPEGAPAAAVPQIAVGAVVTAQGLRTIWSRCRVEGWGAPRLDAGAWVVGTEEFERRLAEGTARYAPDRRSVGVIECSVVDLSADARASCAEVAGTDAY